jgi:hypothetical protein
VSVSVSVECVSVSVERVCVCVCVCVSGERVFAYCTERQRETEREHTRVCFSKRTCICVYVCVCVETCNAFTCMKKKIKIWHSHQHTTHARRLHQLDDPVPKVVKGWLWKQGSVFKRWSKRYSVYLLY